MEDHELLETVVSKEVVYPGTIVRLEHWQVTLSDGSPALREIACLTGASAVVALDDTDNIVLVRQYRVSVGRITLELPAGKLDSPQEDPLEAAKRELSEETGLEAANWQKLTVFESTPGFCNERIHLYLAEGLTQGESHPDEGEFVSVCRVSLREALTRVMDGTIRDGKTISGILMACQHKRILLN